MNLPTTVLLRRVVCTAGWACFAFLSVVIVILVATEEYYKTAGKPEWMTTLRIGTALAAAVGAIWLGGRGHLPGTGPTFTRRSLLYAVAIIITVIVGASSWMGFVLESRNARTPQSPEHARSVAEALAILDQPILKSVGISQGEVMQALGISPPMTPEGDPFMGHQRLVGYNKEDRIQVKVQGPEANLWNMSLFFFLDGGKIDPAQPSHRRAKTFLDHWIGADAWIWTAQMVETLIPNGSDTQTVQRTFGNKTLTLHMSGQSAKNPAAVNIIVVPATQEQQIPRETKKPEENQFSSKDVSPKPATPAYHPLD